MTIGLDIGYNDNDSGTEREGQAVWTGTKDSWQKTSVFGDAVIGNISTTPYNVKARTNKVCPRHHVTRLNKMKIPIQLNYIFLFYIKCNSC